MNEMISMVMTIFGIAIAAGIGITVALGLPAVVILWAIKKLNL